jgi:hypothetical protein
MGGGVVSHSAKIIWWCFVIQKYRFDGTGNNRRKLNGSDTRTEPATIGANSMEVIPEGSSTGIYSDLSTGGSPPLIAAAVINAGIGSTVDAI